MTVDADCVRTCPLARTERGHGLFMDTDRLCPRPGWGQFTVVDWPMLGT